MYGYGMGYGGLGYGYGYGYGFDPTIVLVLIGVVISLWAQSRVTSTYNKYSKVRSYSGMTGADAALRLLHSQGIYDVSVRPVAGNLTDHYDPRTKVVNLSESVYRSTSIAALGVAAHECGHAMQHNEGYAPLQLRSTLVPIANFGSRLSWPMILIGVMLGGLGSPLCQIGILMFSLAVLFQLVTLPVEFNASSRAVKLLDSLGILSGEEIRGTRSVLNAAAWTYVAAAASSMLQLLRLIILYGGRRRDD
ncbi:MAG: zinc metallopeptidase [Lachnospiraceae bacterium]|nr:zinc metallopeptidase [Lachnospiraceae bacterium]